MKTTLCLTLACLLAATPSCSLFGGEDNAADSGVDTRSINQLLASISDEPSAQAAKGPLEAAVAKLKDALGSANAGVSGVEGGASGMASPAVNAVLAKFGISAETTSMITGLLDNPAVKGVLGATLTQLKGLIPAM